MRPLTDGSLRIRSKHCPASSVVASTTPLSSTPLKALSGMMLVRTYLSVYQLRYSVVHISVTHQGDIMFTLLP